MEASPIKAEKHDHFINGIPEEDEEVDDDHEDVDQDEEDGHESEDSLTKKGTLVFYAQDLFSSRLHGVRIQNLLRGRLCWLLTSLE